MHYRTDVNAVDYRSTTGRSLPDSYALSDQCERRRLHVDHRAFTARPDTYYDNNDTFFSSALPHQSSHCATTQVWLSVVNPSNTQNVSLSPCSSLATTAIKMWFWSALLLSTGLSSSATLQRCLLKLISAFVTVLRVFAFFPWHWATPFNWRGRCHNTVYFNCCGRCHNTVYKHRLHSQIKSPATASAAILILSQIPCNFCQEKYFRKRSGNKNLSTTIVSSRRYPSTTPVLLQVLTLSEFPSATAVTEALPN